MPRRSIAGFRCWPIPSDFAASYVDAFVARFAKIQLEYRKRKRAFDTLFKHRPRDEAGSFAYRWECVLDRLRRAVPQNLGNLIRSHTSLQAQHEGRQRRQRFHALGGHASTCFPTFAPEILALSSGVIIPGMKKERQAALRPGTGTMRPYRVGTKCYRSETMIRFHRQPEGKTGGPGHFGAARSFVWAASPQLYLMPFRPTRLSFESKR